MAVRQDTQQEIRYIKRQNLEQEQRLVGNYYRDLIRAYGVDCTYWKMNMEDFLDFRGVIDQNVRLLNAYGYDLTPKYDISASMITYTEVETDIFQLQKWGINPNTTVTFYFDSLDFACALATKCGQLKEYKIQEQDIYCEVPEIDGATSANQFPYELKLNGDQQFYKCSMLSGRFQAIISGYDPNDLEKEYEIVCDPYEHTQFNVSFSVNKDLYRSMKRSIESDDYLETLLFLKYKISKIPTKKKNRYFLTGKLHGSILFYDLDMLGKYAEKIHPMVGDVVEIDFPDEFNREKYEITDCFDRQLTQDGINPLLGKYIWKCKARRYVNSYEEDAPSSQSEADDRLEEIRDFHQTINDKVADDVSYHPNGEDAAYGGYDGIHDRYEKDEPKPNHDKYDFIDDGSAIDIHRFACGSKLVTDGYVLLFIDVNGDAYQITTNQLDLPHRHALVEQKVKWLKASDQCVAFINIEGESTKIAVDYEATNGEIELCLDDLNAKSVDTTGKETNKDLDNFFKFKGTKSYIWATKNNLYVKLASNKQLYKII